MPTLTEAKCMMEVFLDSVDLLAISDQEVRLDTLVKTTGGY